MKKRFSLVNTIMIAIILIYEVLNTIFGVVVVETTKKTNTSVYESQCTKLTDTFSELMSETMSCYLKQLTPYASEEDVLVQGTDATVAWMKGAKHLLSSDFDYVAWVDANGNFYSTKDTFTTVKDREYFKAIMSDGKDTFISNVDVSKVTGKSIIHVCKAAKINGKTVGFFTAIVPVENIMSIVDTLTLGETGFAVLNANDGSFIATSGSSDMADTIFNSQDTAALARKTQNQQLIASGKGDDYWLEYPETGKIWYTVLRPIENTNWVIYFMVSQSQVYHSAWMIMNTFIAGGAIIGIILLFVVGIMVWNNLKPLKKVGDNITEIASGNANLSKSLEVKSAVKNEITDVVDGFNTFTGKLKEIVVSLKKSKNTLNATGTKLAESTESTSSAITEIIACIQNLNSNITNQTASVEETSSAVNQISANIVSLNKMVVAQSSNVGQASSAVEEMIGNINSVNRSVEKMGQSFKELEENASNGVQKQNDVNERIRAIEAESQTLQEANQVISAIAEQTNLLAMNAAIEAAHAGESGKGFSVVADEIRKLSETSSEQSKTIGNQLNVIVESINGIVKASQEAEVAFSSVSTGIVSTDNIVSEIRNAMTEQAEGSKMITVALQNMNDSTSLVTDASTEMSEGARAILEEVKHLDESTTSMKNAMSEMTIGARKINDTGSMLHELSGVVTESITEIGQHVDQFEV